MRAFAVTPRRLAVAGGFLALILAAVAAAVTVLAVRVDGESMTPTLGDGERVLLRPFSGGDTPGRFAIVVTRFSEHGPTVVKRVVGLPGDRVRITGTRVELQPGGTGPWLVAALPGWRGAPSTALDCCRPTGQTGRPASAQTVPAGTLFLLGDHADASEDSRTFGWAPVRFVQGVAGWRLRAWFLPVRLRSHVRLDAIS